LLLLPFPLVAAAIALGVGPSGAGWSDLLALLRGEADPATREILIGFRLPRIVLAGIVGAALSGAGATFQAVLRNPLADPFILGVSGGSLVGAVLFTSLSGSPSLGAPVGESLAAFAGATATLFVLFHLARIRGKTGATTLLLVGVVLNAFYSAVIVFLLTAGDPGQFQSVLFRLIGWIPSPRPMVLFAAGAVVLVGLIALLLQGHRLNLLAFGEEAAGQLGVEVERTIWTSVIAASLITAAAVAFTGLIGFVGLIVPHLVRTLRGPDHRWLLPGAALVGSGFLILADTTARTVVQPTEIPVGVVTTLLGGPFFLVLFLRRMRAEASR
jgi:iron complex transport system permease protein